MGPTLNDAGDADAGANNLQNFPVITSASESAGTVTVAGTLNSTANQTIIVDFYISDAKDPSNYGEGQTHRLSISVLTDGSGNASFSGVTFPGLAGKWITATATDANNNTSEFSLAVQVA